MFGKKPFLKWLDDSNFTINLKRKCHDRIYFSRFYYRYDNCVLHNEGNERERKDKTPVLEILSNPSVIKSLDLKPGSALTLNASDVHKEVHVLSSPQGVRIGTLNQPFVYKGVLRDKLVAKIYAIEGATLKVEVLLK